jgi:hypothetical protein
MQAYDDLVIIQQVSERLLVFQVISMRVAWNLRCGHSRASACLGWRKAAAKRMQVAAHASETPHNSSALCRARQ